MNKISTKNMESTNERGRFLSSFKVVITLLFVSLTIYILTLANATIMSSDSYYTGQITVSGHGEVESSAKIQKLSIDISPDAIVQSNATSTAKVGTTTSSIEYSKKIVAYLKSKNVQDSDIKVSSSRSANVVLRGDNMNKAKTFAIDIEKISPKRITVNIMDPEVENPALLKSRALDMALNNARNNALKVSRSLGVDLGKVISFDQNNYGDNGGSYGSSGDNYNQDLVTSDITVSFQSK